MAGITWVDGTWIDADAPLFSSRSHGVWLASFVFDGARYFEGVAPDLDLHCARVIRSALALGMAPTKSMEEIMELAWEGIRKFPDGTDLYIRPQFWADEGFIAPDPETTRFALTVDEMPMPNADGFTASLAVQRRPSPDYAPTAAKAACLYPHAGNALRDAKARGFTNTVMCDPIGNVAEFATANIFMVKDGIIKTPAPNSCFLNGITRQRIIALLGENGQQVHECQITPADLLDADEVFNTGNYGKVMPLIKFEEREYQQGKIYNLARKLYWDFSHK